MSICISMSDARSVANVFESTATSGTHLSALTDRP
jgi:hypothetical protein